MLNTQEKQARKIAEVKDALNEKFLPTGRERLAWNVVPGKRGLTKVVIRRRIKKRPSGEDGSVASLP